MLGVNATVHSVHPGQAVAPEGGEALTWGATRLCVVNARHPVVKPCARGTGQTTLAPVPTTADDAAAPPFSTELRERTLPDHADAEGATLMAELMAGTLDRARIGDMLAQHLVLYRVLEGVGERLAGDPVVADFLSPALLRVPTLERDVAGLLGAEAAAAPAVLPSTAAYVARIEATLGWPGGFVAHHYTRYLGDLSGGQHIGRVVARAYPDLSIGFYAFDDIASPKAFKDAYRARLDAAPWGAEERERIVAEVRVAYALSSAVFADLSTPA